VVRSDLPFVAGHPRVLGESLSGICVRKRSSFAVGNPCGTHLAILYRQAPALTPGNRKMFNSFVLANVALLVGLRYRWYVSFTGTTWIGSLTGCLSSGFFLLTSFFATLSPNAMS